MIPPSSTSGNVRSLVLLNFTVLVLHGNNILQYTYTYRDDRAW
jgi:hypothetical protein